MLEILVLTANDSNHAIPDRACPHDLDHAPLGAIRTPVPAAYNL